MIRVRQEKAILCQQRSKASSVCAMETHVLRKLFMLGAGITLLENCHALETALPIRTRHHYRPAFVSSSVVLGSWSSDATAVARVNATTAVEFPPRRSHGSSSLPSASTPDTLEINLQLDALARQCGDPKFHRNQTAIALEAYRLFRTLAEPDTVAYNSVLKALSKISPATLPQPLDETSPKELMGFQLMHNRTSSASPTVTAADQALQLLQEMKRV